MKTQKRKRVAAAKAPATTVVPEPVALQEPVPELAEAAVAELLSAGLPAEPVVETEATVVIEPAAMASSAAVVTLGANAGIHDAIELKATLLRLLDSEQAVTFDVGAVERIDTANLQVLYAFTRDRRKAGRAVAWAGDNAPFREAVQLAGIGSMLDAAPAGGAAQ